MADLSPKLLERRRRREQRDRPWRDIKPASSPVSIASSRTLLLPNTPTAQRPLRRRSELPRTTWRKLPTSKAITAYQRSGPFPFLRLPYDVQLLVGEFVLFCLPQYFKCEDFIPYKDGKFDSNPKATPRYPLSQEGYPTWFPLIQVYPWLAKDLSRAWYRESIFFVKSVVDWNAFVGRATWKNASRIPHLHVDNEFIYCSGQSVNEDANWRSHMILSPMRNLKTLTLYRDDGGPGTYTQGGHDEFNSVDWFVRFAKDCTSLQKIKFALYPWSGFDTYPLRDSNMVTWVMDWEHEWDTVMVKRRPKEDKPLQSWYPASSPITI